MRESNRFSPSPQNSVPTCQFVSLKLRVASLIEVHWSSVCLLDEFKQLAIFSSSAEPPSIQILSYYTPPLLGGGVGWYYGLAMSACLTCYVVIYPNICLSRNFN